MSIAWADGSAASMYFGNREADPTPATTVASKEAHVADCQGPKENQGLKIMLPVDAAELSCFAPDGLPEDHPLRWLTPTPESSPRAHASLEAISHASMQPWSDPWDSEELPRWRRLRGARGGQRCNRGSPQGLSHVPCLAVSESARSTTASDSDDSWQCRAAAVMDLVPPHVPVPFAVGTVAATSVPLRGPTFGLRHRFHKETTTMGTMSDDGRRFTKQNYHGRLSIVTEDTVHSCGTLNYVARFEGGQLSSADGVGFVFSPVLPCPKNIQRIVSIFANKTGRICIRAYDRVVRSNASVRPLEIGDWVAVSVDLEQRTAAFAVWAPGGGSRSSASLAFGAALAGLGSSAPTASATSRGYFACVVKHAGVTLALGS
mmetsp:Transcript_88441/g.250692  ORF Transcript_88441/g.250692 Transcript_88441/m.250692 type:complete len:375 (-) Transcript_88441:32-1156(-)